MPTFLKTPASFRQGARTMPGEYYTSPDVYARERDAVHGRLWNCVGRSAGLAQPGDYMVCDIAGESLIIVRGRDQVLRAFFNVCRHRGTQLCSGAGADG